MEADEEELKARYQYYCDEWKLAPIENPTATTAGGLIGRILSEGREGWLKIFSHDSDEKNQSQYLKLYAGYKTPAFWQGNEEALVMEDVAGRNLLEFLRNQSDEEAAFILADLTIALHENQPNDLQRFPYFEQRFEDLFLSSGYHRLVDRAIVTAKGLLQNKSSEKLLHGDLHHKNVLWDEKRGWLAIDPKGIVGDHVYDFANAIANPIEMPELASNEARMKKVTQLVAARAGIDPLRLISWVFVHSALAACWANIDVKDPRHWLAVTDSAHNIMLE